MVKDMEGGPVWKLLNDQAKSAEGQKEAVIM